MNKRLEEYAKSKGLVTVKESGLVYGKIREMFVVIQNAVGYTWNVSGWYYFYGSIRHSHISIIR